MAIQQKLRLALIPGDGIGREVTAAAQRVLETLPLALEWLELEAGWETFQRQGVALPPATLNALATCAGALFGAVSSPSQRVDGYSSPILALRKHFDLYANLRPVGGALSAAPAAAHRTLHASAVDLLIVRENTECLYIKEERVAPDGEWARAERLITRRASQRIAKLAFEQARLRSTQMGHRQARVTIVHKANVLNLTDGLFRETALAVAADYPDIEVEEQLVDSMLYRLIREPQRYDVIVAPNLYGDILSDAAAALVGGLGLAPSANVGDHFVVAEPVHGSAPDITGQGIANPLATVLAAAMLLRHLEHADLAGLVEQAVQMVLVNGPHPRDLGGEATTLEVTDALCNYLADACNRAAAYGVTGD